ncbi:hypothetical protein [Mitsuaria sp. GD03876]|uniref:hypothetical protein n=1 Tax=Mitsuaria sp. GD03876 TaxID=2975399 RepID=UPI002447C880|nr:hypothetical protein [Mitsuaria sp. GD03876]MDH0866664.1 hypothetical protein [Mitsuaria sp. GD03876]
MRHATLTPTTRRQRGWIWLCLVALLGFQALGLVHRALHGGPMPEPVRLAVAAARQAVEVERVSPDDGGALKFGHLAGSGDCQLLDQLSHALGPIVQALTWTALPPALPAGVDTPHDATLAQWWRKGARGPPRA